ncbi:MAG: hypothetical protein ACT4OK_19745 [Gemmobacter sp.]
MKPFLDPDHPMFARAWVRWATVLFPAAWAIFEAYSEAWVWAAAFGGLAGYAFWVLIVKGPTGAP